MIELPSEGWYKFSIKFLTLPTEYVLWIIKFLSKCDFTPKRGVISQIDIKLHDLNSKLDNIDWLLLVYINNSATVHLIDIFIYLNGENYK